MAELLEDQLTNLASLLSYSPPSDPVTPGRKGVSPSAKQPDNVAADILPAKPEYLIKGLEKITDKQKSSFLFSSPISWFAALTGILVVCSLRYFRYQLHGSSVVKNSAPVSQNLQPMTEKNTYGLDPVSLPSSPPDGNILAHDLSGNFVERYKAMIADFKESVDFRHDKFLKEIELTLVKYQLKKKLEFVDNLNQLLSPYKIQTCFQPKKESEWKAEIADFTHQLDRYEKEELSSTNRFLNRRSDPFEAGKTEPSSSDQNRLDFEKEFAKKTEDFRKDVEKRNQKGTDEVTALLQRQPEIDRAALIPQLDSVLHSYLVCIPEAHGGQTVTQ